MPDQSYITLSQNDLKDPTLFRLNQVVSFLYSQLSQTQGSQGGYEFQGPATFPSAFLQNTNIPTDAKALLTKGAADKLYSPSALYLQSVSGRFQNIPIGSPGQGGSSGGSTPVPPIVSYDFRLRYYSGANVPTTITYDIRNKTSQVWSVLDFGAVGDGVADDSAAINNAITYAATQGGKYIYFPGGRIYKVDSPVDLNQENVYLYGDGEGSVILRGATMPTGQGVIDITASHTGVFDLKIDGDVETPNNLLYSSFGGDPQAAAITVDTSVWIHDGLKNVMFDGVTWFNSGGYSINNVSTLTDNVNISVNNCTFDDCRPNYFGTGAVVREPQVVLGGSGYTFVTIGFSGGGGAGAAANGVLSGGSLVGIIMTNVGSGYTSAPTITVGGDGASATATATIYAGGWTGGIMNQSTSVSPNLGTVKGMSVTNCRFTRMGGNCIWSHSYGFDSHHENFCITGNQFEYIARDCFLAGNVHGGTCTGNTAKYVGWVTLNNTDTPVAQYLDNNYAVGLDSSGYASNFSFSGNTVTEFLGGAFDLDGLRDSVLTGNGCWTTQRYAKGMQTGDTSANGGGVNVSIYGNFFYGCSDGAIVLNQADGCYAGGNLIIHSATAAAVPILLYSLNLHTKDTTVTKNVIYYPANQWCIVESDAGTGTGFDATTVNLVYNNDYRGAKGEFLRNANSGSKTGTVYSTNSSSATQAEQSTLQREGDGSTAAFKLYDTQGSTTNQLAQWQPTNGLYNVSINGGTQTGIITTGPRNTLGFADAMWTGKLMTDGFEAVYDYQGSGTSYQAADANALSDDWWLLRFNKTAGYVEQSIDETAGVRNWIPLVSGAISGLTAGRIPYAASPTSLVDTANLTWDNTLQQLVVTGLTGTASIAVATSYIQSAEGFYSTGTSYQTLNVPSGGMYGRSMVADKYIQVGNNSGVPSATTGDTVPSNGNIYYDTALNKFRGYQNGVWVDMVGGGAISGLTSGRIPYATGSTTIADTGNLLWNNASQAMTITGVTTTPGLNILTAYINSAEGFVTASTATNAIQATGGGVTVKFLIGTTSYTQVADTAANAGLSSSGQGRIYFDSTSNKFRVSENGGAYVDLIGGSISGLTAGRMPYATSSTAIANTVVYWDNANSRMGVNKAVPGTTLHVGGVTYVDGVNAGAGLTVADGYISSDEGYVTANSSYQSFQNSSGGMYARSIRAVVYTQLGNNSSTPSVTTGDGFAAGAIYWDTSGTPALKVYNGSTWVTLSTGGLSSINSMTGSAGNIVITNSTGISIGNASNTVTITNTGVTSATGTTNQVNVSASTGAVTFSLPQSIATGSTPTFNGVISTLAFNANVTGATIAFQTNNTNIQINGNGVIAISSSGSFNVNGSTAIDGSRNGTFVNLGASGTITGSGTGSYFDTAYNTGGGNAYRLRGSGLVDNGGVWISAGGINMNAGCAATGYNIFGGGTGQSAVLAFAFTVSGVPKTSATFTGGIITAYA